MTAQPVTQAIVRREKEDKLVGWLRHQEDDLAMAAASHLKPSTIIRVAQGALRRDDKLMAAAIANPQSLLHCLLDAARLGHEPGTDQYWLIPFGDEVTGIEGYKGIIERMYRAGGVSSVHVQVVREHDFYRSMGDRTPPVHEYDDFADAADRGPLRGVYAYAIMTSGACSQVIRMGRAEIMRHKAMSRGSGRSDSPWKAWEEAMWKKTPLRALEPYVPTSSEWLIARAQAAAQSRITAPGWAPPVTAAAAPLQLVASEVTGPADTPDASPAQPPAASPGADVAAPAPPPVPQGAGEALPPLPGEEEDPAPAAQATPPPAAGAAPGDAPGSERHRKLIGVVQGHFKRLGYTDDEREQRLAAAAVIAGVSGVASLNDMTPEELSAVADTLSRQRDRDKLTALLVAQEEARHGE